MLHVLIQRKREAPLSERADNSLLTPLHSQVPPVCVRMHRYAFMTGSHWLRRFHCYYDCVINVVLGNAKCPSSEQQFENRLHSDVLQDLGTSPGFLARSRMVLPLVE